MILKTINRNKIMLLAYRWEDYLLNTILLSELTALASKLALDFIKKVVIEIKNISRIKFFIWAAY